MTIYDQDGALILVIINLLQKEIWPRVSLKSYTSTGETHPPAFSVFGQQLFC